MITDSGVLPLDCLCCSISFIVNWASISRDFPQDISILTVAFMSLLAFAVAISIISMSRLFFTLIRRLHHKLQEACIELRWKANHEFGRFTFVPNPPNFSIKAVNKFKLLCHYKEAFSSCDQYHYALLWRKMSYVWSFFLGLLKMFLLQISQPNVL